MIRMITFIKGNIYNRLYQIILQLVIIPNVVFRHHEHAVDHGGALHNFRTDSAESSDDDDDSDDEICIVGGSGNLTSIAAQNEILTQLKYEVLSTHFLAIRITNPEILSKTLEIQKHAIKQEEVTFCIM